MVAQGSGAIVNVASVNAFYQPDGATIDYGAAKAALVNLTKSLAQEFGPQGIHINAVSPGPVSTDLWLGEDGVAETVGHATGVDAATARKQIIAAMGGHHRPGGSQPRRIATLVVVLASERTANLTGSNYVIDGGLTRPHRTPRSRSVAGEPVRLRRQTPRPRLSRIASSAQTVRLAPHPRSIRRPTVPIR